MINYLASKTTSWLINRGVISNDDRDLYQYASYLLIFTMIPSLTSISMGLLSGVSVIDCILFSASFSILRKYAGGFHFQSKIPCIISSISIEWLFILVVKKCINTIPITLIFEICSLTLIILSPVISSQRNLSSTESRYCRKKVAVALVISHIFCYCMIAVRLENHAFYVESAIIMTAILQYPAKFNQTRA